MDFFETVYKRKTIRKYKKDNPSIVDLYKIIDSARLAPSATNSQNWQFLAIYNPSIKQKMADAVLKAYENLEGQIEDMDFLNNIKKQKPFATFFKDAPLVIACIETQRTSAVAEFLKEKGMPLEEILLCRPDSSLLSMGAAIENMSLTATALGYGSCWMCAPILAYKEFKEILNLDETQKIVSLLAIGKPNDDNQNRPEKKQVEDILKIIT